MVVFPYFCRSVVVMGAIVSRERYLFQLWTGCQAGIEAAADPDAEGMVA